MNIIMISGKQGSGKTTLAENLWQRFFGRTGKKVDKAAVRIKFADPLYAMQEAINDIMREHKVFMPHKDGRLLQLLGTEWGRKEKGDDVWIKIAKRQIERYEMQGAKLVIIDDCRFKNEFEAFPEALRIRLKADQEIRKPRTESWREEVAHASETDLDSIPDSAFELVIDTGVGKKEDTMRKVLEIMELKFNDELE